MSKLTREEYRKIGTPEQRLQEECAEVIQAISKGVRFGWNDWHPDRPPQGEVHWKNHMLLLEEMRDVVRTYNELADDLEIPRLEWK